MTKMKLSYFDINGGRGEPLRLALTLGKIAFEDDRFAFPELAERRAALPYRAVPVMEIDGKQVAQTNALLRYVGRQCDLYPEGAFEALICDEIMDAIEDISNQVVQTFGLEGEALKNAREKLVEDKLKIYLKTFDARVKQSAGDFVAGTKMSVADLRLFVWASTIKRGVLDHVPTDLVDKEAPALAALVERVGANARIRAYYKARGV